MPKTYTGLYEQIFPFEHLLDAYRRARRGKRRRPDVAAFEFRYEDELLRLRDELRDAYTQVYFPGDDLFAATCPRGQPIGNQTSHDHRAPVADLCAYLRSAPVAAAAYERLAAPLPLHLNPGAGAGCAALSGAPS